MSSFDLVDDRRQGWAPQALKGAPAPTQGFGDSLPETRSQTQALPSRVTISDWPAQSPELQHVTNLGRSMFRAVVVCMLSSVCAALAVVALVAFAKTGWDAVHPWVSMMALVGSVGLLGIGLTILIAARARVERHLGQRS